MLWFHKPVSELWILFQFGSGCLCLSVDVPSVAQIYVRVLHVPFTCLLFLSLEVHICYLTFIGFQDF